MSGQGITGIISNNYLIGEIKAIDIDFPNTPTPDQTWKKCDGSIIDDSNSPFDGYRIRNFNGATVILNLTTISSSPSITVSAEDITAISAGDNVSGVGIDANTKVLSVIGTTVTLTKNATTSATNDISFTNSGKFLRGGIISGIGQQDEMQQITGTLIQQGARAGIVGLDGVFTRSGSTTYAKDDYGGDLPLNIHFDSANSTAQGGARVGAETRPENISIIYFMKVK